MQNNIITDRLKLDILTLEDHDFIMLLVNSKGWIEFIGDRNVHSTDDAIAYVNKIMNTQNLFYWVVRVKHTNIAIGIISFLKRGYLENFDIGFALLPQFSGHGYALEAAKEVLLLASKNPGYYPVVATTIPRNVSSIKLLIKLGLHFEREIEVENARLHIYSN